MRKPLLVYESTGASGNIYWILGTLSKIMKSAGQEDEYEKINQRVLNSGSYEEALTIISEVVELKDISK